MTTEELAELFLAHLYDLAEAAPHPNFLFPANDFAPKLGITDREELQKALDFLGDRGLIILASFDMFGGISAGITIEGSSFVEKGGETGIIEQYRRRPQPFLGTPPGPSFPAVAPPDIETLNEEKRTPSPAGRAVEAILADIKDILERDDTVSAEARKDLFSDLATLRIQMERSVKNRPVIDALLNNLSGIPSIAPLVAGLNSIINAYLR